MLSYVSFSLQYIMKTLKIITVIFFIFFKTMTIHFQNRQQNALCLLKKMVLFSWITKPFTRFSQSQNIEKPNNIPLIVLISKVWKVKTFNNIVRYVQQCTTTNPNDDPLQLEVLWSEIIPLVSHDAKRKCFECPVVYVLCVW